MLFTRDKSFYKTLIKLAIPISLQYLVSYAVGLADNLMVASLGDSATSGVYISNTMQTILQLFTGGIEGAVLLISAQYWGKKDTASIKKIIGVGVKFSLGAGLLFTLAGVLLPGQIISLFINEQNVVADGATYLRTVGFSYIIFCITQIFIASMRSVENAKIGMYVSFTALFANVGLNYLLIFGVGPFPEMGISGAAVATLVSRILEMCVIIVYVFFVDKKLKLRVKDLLPTDPVLCRDFVKYGLPLVAGNVVWAINNLANTKILGGYNSAGLMTATSLAMNLNNLCYVWMNGLSNAVGIITGKTVGRGEYEKMKQYAKTVQIIFLFVGLFSGAVVISLRDVFISMYGNISAEAAAYAKQLITVISVTIIGSAYQATCLFGLVKSGGDVSFVFKNDAIFVFGVVLPSAIIAYYLGAAPWVVFALLKVDQILKCFVAVVKINSFNWMKNLTRDSKGKPAEEQGA